MKKELTMTLISVLALIANSLCFRQVFLKSDEDYLKFSYIFLLIAVGAVLLWMFGFFLKRLVAKQT